MFEKSFFSGVQSILVLWKLSNEAIETVLSCLVFPLYRPELRKADGSTFYVLQAGVLLLGPENTGNKFLRDAVDFQWTVSLYTLRQNSS
jgi:SpoVK/Ycf46/Vps4 family AAA+-type ATPase